MKSTDNHQPTSAPPPFPDNDTISSSTSSPFQSIPFELLSRIFCQLKSLYCPTSLTEWTTHQLITITLVSRLWSQCAILTPQLWTVIDWTRMNDRMVEKWISRVGVIGLEMLISVRQIAGGEGEERLQRMLNLLPRCQSLKIVDWGVMNDESSLPLMMNTGHHQNHGTLTLDHFFVGSLKSLSGLQELGFYGNECQLSPSPSPPSDTAATAVVEMPTLTKLKVPRSSMLRRIRASNLRELVIRHLANLHSSSDEFLLDNISESFPRLEVLELLPFPSQGRSMVMSFPYRSRDYCAGQVLNGNDVPSIIRNAPNWKTLICSQFTRLGDGLVLTNVTSLTVSFSSRLSADYWIEDDTKWYDTFPMLARLRVIDVCGNSSGPLIVDNMITHLSFAHHPDRRRLPKLSSFVLKNGNQRTRSIPQATLEDLRFFSHSRSIFPDDPALDTISTCFVSLIGWNANQNIHYASWTELCNIPFA